MPPESPGGPTGPSATTGAPTGTYIGVDVGGGGIRVRAVISGRGADVRHRGAGARDRGVDARGGGAGARDRGVEARGQGVDARDRGPVPRVAGRIDARALGERIGALVASLRPGPAERVAVGLTGMPGLLDSPAELAGHLHARIATGTVIVASDALTTHLGALGGRAGCVVAAGTGVIALGTDHATTWRRADGWGHLLGDAGSGSWVGARGLRAALRHDDGREGGSAHLHRLLGERFGGTAAAVKAVYSAGSPAHELAAFAPLVAEAAYAGDPVAHDIWQRAGAQLAETARAAVGDLPAEFSWGGRLFDAGAVLLEPFRAALTVRVPGARLVEPAAQAADGALLLARRGLPGGGSPPASYAVEFAPGHIS